MEWVEPLTAQLGAWEPWAGVVPEEQLRAWVSQGRVVRYRMGQEVLQPEGACTHLGWVVHGGVRWVGTQPPLGTPVTLAVGGKGCSIGTARWGSGLACEWVVAKEETVCWEIPLAEWETWVDAYPALGKRYREGCSVPEAYWVLSQQPQTQDWPLVSWAQQAPAVVRVWEQSEPPTESDYRWLPSGPQRWLGFPVGWWSEMSVVAPVEESPPEWLALVPYGEAGEPAPRLRDLSAYPLVRATAGEPLLLACFAMLCRYYRVPFRKEVLQRALSGRSSHEEQNSLYLCAAVGEFLGLHSQLLQIPRSALGQLPHTALVQWEQDLAVVYDADATSVVLAHPKESQVREVPLAEAMTALQPDPQVEAVQVLLLYPTPATPKQKFGLSWFVPFVIKYRRVLTEVLVASFFVQLFGLANPLVIQVLIDKVLVQGGLETLNVIGLFLLIVALFEGVLSALRMFLFADTTNRIDFALGTEIIDRLFRLPLRYFEKRPVGEVASRVNELENIRQFLTGTALTVALDALFSVIYIVIMFVYNWMLALVALAVIPLFAILTFLVTPILRSQLRTKAERHAASQSYLVETLTGIQTVKGQSIELQSRWKWQDLYSRYVAAGFRTVVTSATAGSISHFLEQLSGLVVLWVGARMVLGSEGQFTLGQLIAFRIIAGYVISPLLRLIQLWQNFQETAISLERLSDIVDTPTELELSPSRLALPPIVGEIRFEELSFRFAAAGPLQLVNVNLVVPAGAFVGIVGQSGSGKSTLLKLVSRLYEPLAGRILIDGYDIAKVDLYSVRSQIGLVPQEPLLFEGTVRENIALTRPESTDAEIMEAARIALAHEFIMNLPQGYDTPVGERGAGLSGGQRQRIAIARTVLQNPALLLLDEATSALDYDTERRVCRNLIEFCRGRTVLFISHRLKVLQGADKIVVMHQGMLEEEGTHGELMARRGRYYCLYQQQDAEISLS